jgi:Flp pilus assembly protein TadB
MITAIAAVGLLLVAALFVWATHLSRKTRRRLRLTDEEILRYIEETEQRRKERAKYFGNGFYDIHDNRPAIKVD